MEKTATKRKKSDTSKENTKEEKKIKTESSAAKEFLSKAKPLTITIGGNNYQAQPKVFSSGSYGWSLNGRTFNAEVGSDKFIVGISVNLTVRGSKPHKEGEASDSEDN